MFKKRDDTAVWHLWRHHCRRDGIGEDVDYDWHDDGESSVEYVDCAPTRIVGAMAEGDFPCNGKASTCVSRDTKKTNKNPRTQCCRDCDYHV